MQGPKIVSAAQMAAIDRRTIEVFGVPGVELMERAGRRVFEAIAQRWEELAALDAVVVCGKGNNGGDGYVVARLLHEAGAGVRTFVVAPRAEVKGDAAVHLGRLEASGVQVETAADEGGEGLGPALQAADLVVDALLGTGARGAPRGAIATAIGLVNDSRRPAVAVDLPSGVDADTGAVEGDAVTAALTVTFGLAKPGHLFYPGRARCGSLQLTDIGFPGEVIDESPAVAYLLEEETLAGYRPPRPGDVHKGVCGRVAVIAGSEGMTGAAALAATAALRAGAGAVTLGVPAGLNDILEAKLTEVMTRPLPQVRRRRCLATRALGDAEQLAAAARCLALGPGLGRHRETVELVRRFVGRLTGPAVLDADALYALAGRTEVLRACAGPLVLTPHAGEFARLVGISRQEVAADGIRLAGQFARQFGVTLVLKGAPSLVGLADGRVFVNPTGNAGMATAGSGDVLTGLVAGLVAQGVEAPTAACLGVFIHGRAGDRARDRLGEWGMVATDIADELSEAVREVFSAAHRST